MALPFLQENLYSAQQPGANTLLFLSVFYMFFCGCATLSLYKAASRVVMKGPDVICRQAVHTSVEGHHDYIVGTLTIKP